MGSRIKPRVQSANIFINYRREDSAGHAGRLFDALSGRFEGRLFMDVDNLDPGTDFIEAIEEAVGSCEALMVVIGREWLTIADKTGRRRLDDPADFVRLEVESALARRVRVIPVLVEDAAMPSAAELPPSIAALARRHAIELSDDRWAYDVDRLTRTIQVILEEKRDPATRVETPDKLATPTPIARAVAPKVDECRTKGARPWLLSLGALVWVAVVLLVSVAWIRHTPRGNDAPVASQPPPTDGVVIAAPVPSIVTPVGGEPAATPTGDVDDGNRVPTAPPVVPIAVPAATAVVVKPAPAVEPVHRVEAPAPNRADAELAVPTVRVTPVPTPTLKAEETTIPFADEAPAPAAPTASPPVPASRPARVTIVSPRNGEVVGSDVMVRGVVVALVDGQAFLGIRQRNGAIYPRGEIFPDADGEWSIKLRSSKEKSFEILVVTSTSKEATQVLRDQRSRDDGLSVLPEGASISSSVVSLKRQGRLVGILNPKDAAGDR